MTALDHGISVLVSVVSDDESVDVSIAVGVKRYCQGRGRVE